MQLDQTQHHAAHTPHPRLALRLYITAPHDQSRAPTLRRDRLKRGLIASAMITDCP